MAAGSLYGTEIFLLCGCLVYAWFESLRVRGIRVPVISTLTQMASRPRDADRFVLGPITLGLGAFLSLALFPPQIAAIAVYALAFGDGFASLIGKLFGRIRPRFLRGKSLEGSFACFVAVYITTYAVSRNVIVSLLAAAAAVIVEAFPLGDYDNIALPVAVGFVVMCLV
jgi:dolichol kinase